MQLRRNILATLVVLSVALAGCSGSRPTMATPSTSGAPATTTAVSVPPTTAPLPPGVSLVAEAKIAEVPIYLTADTASGTGQTLSNPNPNGAPLVFLVIERDGDWVHVYLPVRPNGANGWVRASDVDIRQNPYSITVNASEHELTLEKDAKVVATYPVGIGQGQYPTPGGVYYIKELHAPPNPDGAYGPYAYGLSGFSEVDELANFNGGDGVIGIHGTNDPSSVGANVSHGCIRMNNADITALAEILPLGTPVHIEA